MQRYFVNQAYTKGAEIKITDQDYHHMIRVMRMSIGDTCYVSFTDRISIIAEISKITEDEVQLFERSKEHVNKELKCHVSIACGYPKGDKLDWITQKSTELGMHSLIGFPSHHSVVKWDEKKRQKREQRLQKIAKEAAEQSHRQVVPSIQMLDSKQSLLEQLFGYDAILVAYEESAKTGEHGNFAKTLNSLNSGQKVLIIFGPEGGFDSSEIQEFEKYGATCCALGPRILRAETAPLYALSAMSYCWELS